jgi:MFS family permease
MARLANSSLIVLLGYHLYQLTGDPLALGWLGLAQAAPAITLVLYGGVIADRHSRRMIVILGRGAYAALAACLALGTMAPSYAMVWILYGAGFLLGCAAAFTSPAVSGLEGEIVPARGALRAVSILGSASQAAGLAGPVLGSVLFDFAGPGLFYAVVAALFIVSQAIVLLGVRNRPAIPRSSGDGTLRRIAEGIRYVVSDQILIGSMALDLFAVFFGGATALLPIFATDILHVGPTGFGLLRAAISVGSLAAMLVAVRHPPRGRAGLALFLSIAGFGVGIIVFAVSRNFVLSLIALAIVGACDGVSMVIRQAILRLIALGPMRGRISAVRSVFINSSNELGDFESGMLAGAVGAVAAVWIGGVTTLLVVAVTAWRAPRLLRLDLAALEQSN